MTSNGHAPEPAPVVTDLDAIIERTRVTRVLRISGAMIREDTLTLYELALVGRTVGLTPQELLDMVRERAGWTVIELAQAFAWVIARRAEPALTWEEAQHFGLDLVTDPPDPTPAVAKRSRRRGQTGPSTCIG